MTDPIEGLMTIAEIAITLAGFSGLIAAIRVREEWTTQDRFRLIYILLFCFLVVICALLPIFTAAFFSDPSSAWKLSCGIYGVVNATLVVRVLWKRVKGEYVFSNPAISYPLTIVAFGVTCVALLAGAGVAVEASPSLLGLVLMWGIVAPAAFFILALQAMWSPYEQ